MLVLPKNAPGKSEKIICIPDPQYETSFTPGILQIMFDYIIAANPKLVVCVGDLVEGNTNSAYSTIAAQFSRLTSAGIKWMTSTGNHDYSDTSRSSLIDNHFTVQSWMTPYVANSIRNTHTTITIGGVSWLVVCLEWSPRDAVVSWADQVIKANNTKPVLLVTHSYMCSINGLRYEWALFGSNPPGNPHTPDIWQMTPGEGINDGQELWTKLVEPNSNIRLVWSGHIDTFAVKTDTRTDGSLCHQISQDYQYQPYSGGAWLVEYDFDSANKIVSSRVYSPYLNQTRIGAEALNLRLALPD